ncbi:MAG: PDZ domain-containing protein, partial [Paracoccaceae bacterium]
AGDEVTLPITLGRREEAEGAVPAVQPVLPPEPQERELLGMTLSVVTNALRQELNLPRGLEGLVVTDMNEDSQAWDKGLRAGDVLTEAGQQPVRSIEDLEERIDDATEAGRKSILLLVRRGGDPRFVALGIAD